MMYLSITESDFPVIPIIEKYFLLAVNTKHFCGLVWLADWFDILSVHSNNNNICRVKLKIRNDVIEICYSIFYPKNIIGLSEYGIVIDLDYADKMSIYIYKKLSEFNIQKENNNIGFFEVNGHLGFNGYDSEAIAFQYTPDTTIETYAEGLNKILTNKAVMFALCCSCASLFLAYLTMQCGITLNSFVISFFGKTTTGKSTVQSLMASIYSKPDNENIYTSFFGTNNAVIKRIANKFGVPQIFDEATVSGNMNMENLIYIISLEHDKQRCTSSAVLKKSDTWKTVVITSSENRLLSETHMHNKGLEARCLNFTDSREHAEQINDFCSKNYGILGKTLSEYLLKAEPKEMIDKYNIAREKIRNSIGVASLFDLSERLINEYALILLAAEVLNEFDIKIKTNSIINLIVANHNEISRNSNIAENYYNHIMSYIASNVISTSIKIEHDSNKVAIIDTLFLQILKKHAASNTDLVIKELDKSGYIIRIRTNTPKSRQRFNGVLANCYQLKLTEKTDIKFTDQGMTLGYILENFEGIE